MTALMHVYADESCKDDHRYLALGGTCLEDSFAVTALARLKAVREAHNTHGEVKWSKVSRAKLSFYKQFVDVFFDCSKHDEMHFHSLYVDTRTINNAQFNYGDRDLGFNKLIYQLLLHKFGRKYAEHHHMHVYLDDRSTKHQPADLAPMLNRDLARHGLPSNGFRRVRFQDSKSTDLLQLNDLLVGTVGFKMNRHDKRPECAPHKIELAQHILERAWANDRPHRLHHRQARRFTVWPFRYNQR